MPGQFRKLLTYFGALAELIVVQIKKFSLTLIVIEGTMSTNLVSLPLSTFAIVIDAQLSTQHVGPNNVGACFEARTPEQNPQLPERPRPLFHSPHRNRRSQSFVLLYTNFDFTSAHPQHLTVRKCLSHLTQPILSFQHSLSSDSSSS